MSVRRELETLRGDLRGAIRQFARAPMPTLTMAVVLAPGIGANSALFTRSRSPVRHVAGMEPASSSVRLCLQGLAPPQGD